MAGVLPGVEIHRRKSRIHNHRFHDGHSSFRSSPEHPMDEAALRARRSLEEKLGYNRPKREVSSDGNGLQFLGKTWNFQFGSIKSRRRRSKGKNVCAVCLDEFGGLEDDIHGGVMELPCSHIYHSGCLLPWLADHPNCPSCRNPVQF